MLNTTQSGSPKVCLLGASLGIGNFGVNVLTIGTVQSLLHAYPDADISILDYAPEATVWHLQLRERSIQLPLINIRFSKKPWQPNHIAFLILLALVVKLIPFERLRRKVISGNACLQDLTKMDLVTAISGGDSFSDIYGMRRFFYTSLPVILVLLLRKRLILLPQTIGPFQKGLARVFVRYILRRAEIVYARDLKGVKDAETLLGEEAPTGKLRFNYDLGFVVDAVPPVDSRLLGSLAGMKEKRTLVGMNVSGLLFMGGYTRKNMFGLRAPYDQVVYQMLDYFIEQEKACVLLIPHVLGPANTESDSVICRQLFEELRPRYSDRLQLLPDGLDEREVKYVIGQCDFFVGARMHACIAALSQAVPTLPIAYSDKFKGVMDSIGAEIVVADPRSASPSDILERARQSYTGRVKTRNQLLQIMPELKEKALGLFRGFAADESSKNISSDILETAQAHKR